MAWWNEGIKFKLKSNQKHVQIYWKTKGNMNKITVEYHFFPSSTEVFLKSNKIPKLQVLENQSNCRTIEDQLNKL